MTPKDAFAGMPSRCPDCGFTSMETLVPPGLPPLRVDELFSCNDAPLEHERAVLEAIVRESDDYISVLQQRISDTRNTLEALLQEKSNVAKHAAAAKALLNPVRRLSADVLIEIFTACTARIPIRTDTDPLIDLPSNSIDSLNSKAMPWVLSQVCATWRTTALETAKLWSYIKLDMDEYVNHMEYVFRFGILLARTRTHPLSVSISANTSISHQPILAMILSTSSRWAELRVSAPFHAFLPFNNVSQSLPVLEVLAIHILDDANLGAHPEPSHIVHGFKHAPKLRSLSLVQAIGKPISFSKRFALPVAKVSRLRAHMAPAHAASLLCWDGAQTAESACFVMLEHGLQRLEVPMTRHAYLRDLSVVEWGFISSSGAIAELISNLQLPSLQKLKLSYEGMTLNLPVISRETIPALTELEIRSTRLAADGDALADMLHWTPKLTSLTLAVNFRETDLFLSLEKFHDNAFELVPRLHTISLVGAAFDVNCRSHVIVELAEARRLIACAHEPLLKRVYLNKDSRVPAGHKKRWNKLRHGGLEILFLSP
ncbi:uncharacterized protein EV420DRAFT_1569451 [Desarmillaria tabescens]|uniref:F-box domain-containing protein n=1 Tax=Armillaria tabescens TaxID=1929756 RepID=A0AA39MV65_ARMTA|nr:uncharacterized protein EV420DRAFT_1569451 [Desarmillaria tabescens]KAK0447020.1 hypothetical protein EV420DRAFT_1569451 [Desarmillaria tabescens]